MRAMTPAQREKYVQDLAKQRAAIQAQINADNEKRRVYIAQAQKQGSAQDTLDQAILGSVREEAGTKGFTF